MSKIVNLNGKEISVGEASGEDLTPDADVVAVLEEVLADAKAGKVASVAIVIIAPEIKDVPGGDRLGYCIVGDYAPYPLMAGLERIKHMINKDLDMSLEPDV